MNETLPAIAWAMWGANALFDTAGQLLLKAAAVDEAGGTQRQRWGRMLRRPVLWLGLACFVAEFVFWLAFLSLVPLSAGVLLGSINIVVVMLVGRVLYSERLTPLRSAGMLLIAGGVALVGGRCMKLARFYLLGFGALMTFDALAQFCVKFAGTEALPLEASNAWLLRVLAQPWLYGALLGYGGAFVTWMTLLQRAPIGPAFAASHLEIVAVLAISALWLGERITALQALGALLIFAGIVCLAFGEARQDNAVSS